MIRLKNWLFQPDEQGVSYFDAIIAWLIGAAVFGFLAMVMRLGLYK